MSALQKLIDTPGIVAACGGPKSVLDFAFLSTTTQEQQEQQEQWKGVFLKLVTILDLERNEKEVKLILNDYSIVLRRSGETYVGLVAYKGHPVIKSLQRMLRNSFRHFGVPVPQAPSRQRHLNLVKTAPAPVVAPVVTPAPSLPGSPPSGGVNDPR